MFPTLSLVTSVKDYIEVVHKLLETDPNFVQTTYYDFGSLFTFTLLSGKQIVFDFLTFHWLQNVWSIPTKIPDIASAMISEISIFDGSFQNSQILLEKPLSYGNNNFFFSCSEKFMIGLFNSFFLCFPTSAAHIITFRRFVMQGLEAGFLSGLGTITGNILWIGSILFGFRFLVIPWLSLDLFRFFLGFLLIVKYMWDSSTERRVVLEDFSKRKIFLLTFLLSFTEQTTLFPFLSNLSIGSDATLLESFPTQNISEFGFLHISYLTGILLGSLSFLQFTCWFLENPAFQMYMWLVSSFKTTTTIYSKGINFLFLYLTMICAIANLSYFGLDYTLTSPLGFLHEDRLLDQKELLETSFLNTKASDRNTRRNRGRHGRRERWKRRVRRYRTFDASLYDQGVYDLFTVEDLNYGFDRFWLRRKIRNHRVRFRFFPGPWMRSFKKQLSRPRLESFMGPRLEFFRILFEQSYHPEFHEFSQKKNTVKKQSPFALLSQNQYKESAKKQNETPTSIYWNLFGNQQERLLKEKSSLRKFLRKFETRVNISKIQNEIKDSKYFQNSVEMSKKKAKTLPSKTWKFFTPFETFSSPLGKKEKNFFGFLNKEESGNTSFSKKDRFLQRYKTFLQTSTLKNSQNENTKKTLEKPSTFFLEPKTFKNEDQYRQFTFLHPLKFYLQKEKALKRKFQFYGVKLYRNFQAGNNAPYFRVMMKKFFYHYKPTLRWERTLRVATMRRQRRKSSRIPRRFNVSKNSQNLISLEKNSLKKEETMEKSSLTKPTHFFSLVEKRASRYRAQIYKDVLQHWYYSPLNRFLLKVDVDSFIRRQPNSYFLTTTDEKFLHLKRQLFSEYFESLRWYTYMQHYSTMKNQIGGTKSFSSRSYNQQFTGTFKKIRHLFNITPSFEETSVLKFDQPLFNEYPNTQEKNLLQESFFHEELLADDSLPFSNRTPKNQSSLSDNFSNQSAKILRQYLLEATPIRKNYIEKSLVEKNSWDLTGFFYRGQKIRGKSPITNERDFLNQEKILFSPSSFAKMTTDESSDLKKRKEQLWFDLLKKCQTKLYDQEALKNYVSLKKEKYDMKKQKHEKYLKTRLERMKNSLFFQTLSFKKLENFSKQNLFGTMSPFSSSVQKSFKESVLWEKNSGKKLNFSESSLETFFTKKYFLFKTNIRQNRFFLFQNSQKNILLSQEEKSTLSNQINIQKFQYEFFLKNLKNAFQKEALDLFESERLFKQNFSSTKVEEKFPFAVGWWNQIQQKFGNILKFQKSSLHFPKKIFQFHFKIEKDLDFWKRREMALSKRKKLRKTLKRLRNQKMLTEKISFSGEKKTSEDFSFHQKTFETQNRQKIDEEFGRIKKNSWKKYSDTFKSSKEFSVFSFYGNIQRFFKKQFTRKRTRMRRYSSFKGRGPIKKRTFREKVKRQFRNLKKYAQNQQNLNTEEKQKLLEFKKAEFFEFLTQKKSSSSTKQNQKFQMREQKQRRTRQMKHRVWKKKKQNFAQKRRKLKKRRRSTVSKIRVFNKKLHRILAKNEIQNWWWQHFFPKFQKATEKSWQLEKTEQIRQQLGEFSEKEILKRDSLLKGTTSYEMLQIGDKDFKPLALPEALRLREKLVQEKLLNFEKNENGSSENIQPLTSQHNEQKFFSRISNIDDLKQKEIKENKIDLLEKISQNIFVNELKTSQKSVSNFEKFQVSTNPVPFYAGWDENSRKFVVTNRLLAREKTFENNFENSSLSFSGLSNNSEYSKAPLQGMNAATTLYWQIPFTTYDPDQFFALGMDGFSPLGWRNFSFKHSKQTIQPLLIKNFLSLEKNSFSKNLQLKFLEKKYPEKRFSFSNQTFFQKNGKRRFSEEENSKMKLEIGKNFEYRRILKKQKRLKKHPRPPVWFPSGSLSQQILPVHYIYVFYKRSRLPRDRYIRRRLRTSFLNEQGQGLSLSKISDFTLRKRAKPRRKYHRKRLNQKNHQFFLKRRKFRSFRDQPEVFRPTSKTFEFESQDKRIIQKKSRKKISDSKQSQENLRLRQLRRRVQRQVSRPIWRYHPRSGGFVWPGDYLRLETVKAPNFLSSNEIQMDQISKSERKKIRKKKRQTLQEWQIQPKKYLVEKHNFKVLKKRLENSFSL